MIRRSMPSVAGVAALSAVDRKGQDDNGKRKSTIRARCASLTKLIFRQLKTIIPVALMLLGARNLLRRGTRTPPAATDEQNENATHVRLAAANDAQPVTIKLGGQSAYENTTRDSPPRHIVDGHELPGPEWQREECTPTRKWQLPQFGPSTCNMLHEMAIDDLEFINCGGSRCAFQVHDMNGLAVILKTPKFREKGYEEKSYSSSWKDTIAMERLGHSPFVLDILGSCGVSQLTEMAQGGNLHDLIKISRQQPNDESIPSPNDNLRIAYHVAAAVEHLHSIDADTASISHNDLCCHQYLLVDGVYKLNDFHLSSITLKNSKGEECPEEPARMNSNLDKMRAPEELLNRDVRGRIHRDKVDVWQMGNVLYLLLTKKWWFEGLTTVRAREAIMGGRTCHIPPQYFNSTDPAVQAIIEGIDMAWTFDPNDRPCAKEIATMLKQALEKLNGTSRKGDDVWRVAIAPLPKDRRYTDSDYYNNLKQ